MTKKIKSIKIENFKAVSKLEMDFNGATAIITGKNNSGKTSFLSGIPNRIRGEKPGIVLKHNEDDGGGVLELTTGEKFEWEFNNKGKDKLTFYTKDGIKVAVTKAIANKFFPPVFDIDVFLNSQPKQQSKMLQALVGIDFTDIDQRYRQYYDERTSCNSIYKTELAKLPSTAPDEVAVVDVQELVKKKNEIREKLNKKYLENKKVNEELRDTYERDKEIARNECQKYNDNQDEKQVNIDFAVEHMEKLQALGYKGKEVADWIETLPKPERKKSLAEFAPTEPAYVPEMPDDEELTKIDLQINEANEINRVAQLFLNYTAQLDIVQKAKEDAEQADLKVKSIEQEKAELLTTAKLPAGIVITEDGITIDGLPLNKNQLSTSKIYTTALMLASLNLGEVKTLYFDASPLDKITLGEIQKWANERDLQLLIEMPDRDGGEIKYEIIQEAK